FTTSRQQQTPTLFPYTTLFRSQRHGNGQHRNERRAKTLQEEEGHQHHHCDGLQQGLHYLLDGHAHELGGVVGDGVFQSCREVLRSEEHTSELQSRENLVCRLLL